jgi:TRAP transporter 4TM/12TM fusion protein
VHTIADPAKTSTAPAVDLSTRMRPLAPAVKAVECALAIGLTVLGGVWALEMHTWFDLLVFKEQYLALLVTLALTAVFLGIKARRTEAGGRVPWHDWIGAALSVVVGGYVVVRYPDLVYDLGTLETHRYVLGAIAVVLVLEATRRTTGWTLVILGATFLLYAKFSHLFPGMLYVPSPSWQRLAIYLYLDKNGILGLPVDVTGTIVIAFILFGRILYAVKGDVVLTDFALAAMGRYRGGPAKVAVVASSLFGTVSGSAVSNVVIDGPITIPMMKKSGYPGHVAAAIEAVASTGGQIMPPVMGITAFLIAEFLSIPYADVVIAAAIPAVLYYLAVFIQVDLEAARHGLTGLPAASLPRMRHVLLRGWVFVVPIVILFWTLMIEGWQPARSAMAAIGGALAVGVLHPSTRPSLRGFVLAIEEAGRTVFDLIVITLIAGLVIGALQVSGLGFNFSLLLLKLAGGSSIVLLTMTAAVCIVLGMGLPTGVVYIMLAVLVSPALRDMGIVPIAAHLFLFYFGMMSMITPPVCLATLAAASIAQANFWSAGWVGMRLAVVAYVVPFVMVYQPGLVVEGSVADVVITALKCALGVLVLSFGAVGFLYVPIGPVPRALLALGGAVVMLTPLTSPFGMVLVGTALALGAALVLWERHSFFRNTAEVASGSVTGQGAGTAPASHGRNRSPSDRSRRT